MHDSATDPSELVLACAETEVPTDGSVITRTVGAQSIALARHSPGGSRIVAFQSKCPHMQGPLRFGHVVDGEVICPWHFMRFDTASGETVGCPDSVMRLATYPVEQVDGNVFVHIGR
jgi:nitrite reductase/ring-hydroxylating ferredoxin subunit